MVVDGGGEWWMLWAVLGVSRCLWVVVSGTVEPFLILCAYDSSTEFPLTFLPWAYPAGALNKRISGLLLIKHGRKILIRAS